MAPSPAAGKQAGAAPRTPTKLGNKPRATPQKLASAKRTPSTPQAAGAKKPDTDFAQQQASDTAEDTKGQAEQAQSPNVEMKDDDDDEGPMNKVSEAGGEAEEGLQQQAPEPVQDDDDTVTGAQQKADDTVEQAGEEAEDVDDTATQKAGEEVGESQDDATDDQEQPTQEGEEQGQGLLSGAQGLANQAQGLAGKGQDAAGEAKDGAEETAEDAQETTEEGADEGQKVAGEEGTDEAGDAAESAQEQAGDATEDAEETVEGATEEAQEGAEGAEDEAHEGVEGAEHETEEAPEATEGAEETADGAPEAAQGAEEATEQAGEAAEGVEAPEGLPIDLNVLKGLEVNEDGNVYDQEGNPIGKLAEGDAEDLAGYPIGEDGEILDDDGDLVGRVELLPDEIKKQLEAKKEEGVELPEEAEQYLDQEPEGEEADEEGEEEGPQLPSLDILNGLTCQIDGLIYDADGNTVGRVTEGDPEELQHATLNEHGEFIDEEGNVVGHAEIHDDAADLVQEGVYAPAEETQAADDLVDGTGEEPEVAAEDGDVAVDGAPEGVEDAVDEAAEGAEEQVEPEEELPGIEDQLPGIEALGGRELNDAGDVVDDKGSILAQIEDEELKQKIIDGEIDPNTLKIDDEGQVVDEEGNVLGNMELAEGAAEKLAQGGPLLDPRILDGKKINKKGQVIDEDGEIIGELRDGELKDCAGKKVNGSGEVLDKNGNVVGHVNVVPGEAAEEATRALLEELGELPEDEEEQEPELQLPDLDILDGLKVNKKGKILDEDGETIGELVDGDLAKCAGKKCNDKGEVLDKDGNVIGRVRTTPQEPEAAEEEPAEEETAEEVSEEAVPGMDMFDGRKLSKKGQVFDDDGEQIGELADGDLAACAGRKINDKGEIVDDNGNVIGHVQPSQPAEEPTGFEEFEGRKVSNKGQVLDDNGDPIGELSEGELEDCAGKKVNSKGEVLDEDGNVIGRVQHFQPPEEQAAPTGFEAFEGRKVTKKGTVLDDEGEILGELADGELDACAGKMVNGSGEVVDEEGNVIGHVQHHEDQAAPTGFEEFDGRKVTNKGQVLDDNGDPIGELADGELDDCVGKLVNGSGEVLDEEGNVIGHVQHYQEDTGPELPPLSILEGLTCNKSGKLVDANNTVVGELVEGDAKKLAKLGITCDAEGQFWDTKGHVIGRAQTVAQEEPDEESIFAGLEGLHVVQDGWVQDEEGNTVGVVTEGDPKKLIGRQVDEDGDILDKKGSVVGHAERYEAEEEEVPEEADLSFLQGKTVNKAGMVIGDDGVPVARLVEGNPKEVAGRQLDDQGQLWNDRGDVIGRVEIIPKEEREAKPEGPFAGLEGLRVIENGLVADENGNEVGEITDGDAKRLIGLAVDEDGDIVDRYGNVKGHAEPLPDQEDEEPLDNSILNGKQLNKQGYVVDENGIPFGRLVEGDAAELAGRLCDENGDIHNDTGKVVGHCDVIPEDQRVHRAEGPFAGLEGLRVVKEGFVEDEDGNRVGQLVEGNPKRLVGMAVDEDGDIIDKYGNVKGHAEPYEEEEEEQVEVDLSALAGTTINKNGNAVDGNGQIIGRLVEGDAKSMIGKKVDGQGQVWDNAGNVVGRCELVFGEDTSAEGPFAGFEGLQIQKDGTVTTPSGDIVGRITEGDPLKLMGHTVDEDGDVVDKNGNTIGKAERWMPEEKEKRINPMCGRRVNHEGEVRDENGDVIGKLTEGDLGHCVGQEIDESGNVVDYDGNKIGECTLLENIIEEEYEGPTEEEIEEARKREEERQIAEKMANICTQTLEKMQPICKQIKEHMDKADRTPKEELDEEELVNQVKPLIEEGGRVLQECNGSLRGLDPDGHIAAQAKGRAGTGEATPEEHRLAETLKELTTTVVTTIDDAKKKLNDMPYAKKKLNPLWGLMTQPLFQILAAVGLLLAGVLGLVGQLLNGLGLGGLVNGLLGGLGINKLLQAFGLGGDDKKKKKKGGNAISGLPIVGGLLGSSK